MEGYPSSGICYKRQFDGSTKVTIVLRTQSREKTFLFPYSKHKTMKSRQALKHPTVAACRKTKSQKVDNKAIPRDLFVNNILPMLPKGNMSLLL